jgi:RHS repeat-associated protein
LGRQTSLIDPESNTTSWSYDNLGRLVSETDPLSEVTSYDYDAAGRLTERTDRRGLVTELNYDDLDRMTSEVWKDGSSTVRTLSFSYDAAGNLLSASDPSASYDYTYDNLYRTTQTEIDYGVGVNSFQLTASFDAASQRTSLGLEVDSGSGWGDDLLDSYTFDALGRVTQITQAGQAGGATVQDKRVDFAYTVDGLFDSITRYKSLAGGSTNEVARSEYTRDDLGRMTSLEHLHDTTSIADYDLTYDAYSRITQIAATSLVGLAGTTDFTYDTTGQLVDADHTHISDEAYSYDENGNRTSSGYTTGTGNRMTSDGTFNYTYDDNGNRLTKVRISTAPADDKTVETQWDHRNRLIGIVTKNNSGVVTKEVNYEYDVFDRRVSKSIDADGAGAAAAEVTRFVYDGGDILASTDSSGDITHRMLHGPAVDQILAIEEDVTGEVLWGLADQLGSIRDIVDDDGNVENHIVYDAFGNVVSETAASVDFRFGFTGRERDEESGLNYHRARYYDTATGRWLSNDPIGFAAGDANIQRYVGNDPVNYRDPSGLLEVNLVSKNVDEPISTGMWNPSQSEEHWIDDFGWGLLQGVANAGNGVQDMIVGTLNTPAAIANTTADVIDWVDGTPEHQRIRIPYLELSDWSHNMVVEESEFEHNFSKGASGIGISILAGQARLPVLRGGSTRAVAPGGALTGGAARAAKFGNLWQKASLQKAITRHAGENYTTWLTKTGKRIYENPATGRQIVQDLEGGYFRIFQPNKIGGTKGKYLDLLGKVPSPAQRVKSGAIKNLPLSGDDLQQWTHFLIE